ncbi:hypothetical protein L288_18835 [Sphingobium quisquiliarum P25]|uniref:Uncharacterized protein n=1 Tax=Sphingobium quisquiliarum P25 TaxID=1329909 RepID=T0HKX1_9SPHN|nr:hypothetical protein [Sphingobium quisquiliarum]EQA99969.1 hypothetical protein L288_18835 [Sphingobium quisquiliarum P25]EZP73619.1 hypothetical protein BV96_01060 [Sphingomonas paucimobilis]
MCEPVTAAIAVGVASVASTTATVIGQAKAAKAQAKALNEQFAAVAEENRLAASAEMFERDRAARREQARIRTAAGEAGLGLNSGAVEQLLLDSAMQNELANQRSLANRESRDAAAKADATSMMSRVQKPTMLGAGLQIGSSALSAWSGIQDAKLRVSPPPFRGTPVQRPPRMSSKTSRWI